MVVKGHLFWRSLVIIFFSMATRNCGVAALSSDTPHPQRSEMSDPLSQIYSNICNTAVDLQEWPDSDKFCKSLSRNSEGKLCPPAFDDGHGPIGVFAMLHRNKDAMQILSRCSGAFDLFCESLRQDILKPDQWRDMEDLILRPCESSHHICVSIFHEHPSLLHSSKDKRNWRPIDDTLRTTLEERLSEYQSRHCVSPVLSLDSILWTPDGAMIAGFVETSTNNNFSHLRSWSADICKSVLGGELTTRPKNLIHVTIGRIIGLFDGVNEKQRNALTDLMRSFNQRILPNMVQEIRQSTTTNGRFSLEEVSLVRNTVWLMHEYIEHASWKLVQSRNSSSDAVL